MDRLSKQVQDRQAGIFPVAGPPARERIVEGELTFRRDWTEFAFLVWTAIMSTVTAVSTGFLAYVLYSLLQALQDAANQINTTGL